MKRPIPLAVIGGYLGAGKTTMLNALLTNTTGQRITVLVNDFGSVNIDAALIRERSDDVIGLENGCVCCSIGGKLMETLIDISARETPPDLLVIEASGVSDPVRIAQVGMLDRAFRLASIVVAVDAQSIEETCSDAYIGDIARRQIEGASTIVLTKTDLIDAERLRSVRARVLELSRTRIVIEADHGKVPNVLFQSEAKFTREPSSKALALREPLPLNLRSFTFRSERCFSRRELKQACMMFGDRLLRAKGFVKLDSGACAELHVVGKRWHMTTHRESEFVATEIVFIGLFDDDETKHAIALLESAASDEHAATC